MDTDEEEEEHAEEELLVEVREMEMVDPTKPEQPPICRMAWFLQPIEEYPKPPPIPSPPCKIISSRGSPEFHFKGWLDPQPEWHHWVNKLSPMYADLWRKAGIFEAIQASTYVVRKDPASITGVLEFWNGETNTFCFWWGEATLTLEDVMILGGFSVLGEPVRGELSLLDQLELMMITQLREIRQRESKVADHSSWMKYFIEGDGGTTEHIAFLSLWLSRFVFPALVVRPIVFPMAIRLARGVRIALAPAVLANVYRELRAMSNHLSGSGTMRVWAPLGMLQLWLWERFISLRPEMKINFNRDKPRIARWHDVGKQTKPSFVKSIVENADEFLWRPYTISLGNWRSPGFYIDKGGWFSSDVAGNEALGSFSRILSACELVGLDCMEHYLPNRVAMQFGLDQDIPGSVSSVNSSWEAAWKTYDKKNCVFYVPPRLFESDVTFRYSIWWKQYFRSVRRLSIQEIGDKKSQSKHEMKKRKSESFSGFTLFNWSRHLYCEQFNNLGQVSTSNTQDTDCEQFNDVGQVSTSDTQDTDCEQFNDVGQVSTSDTQDTDSEQFNNVDQVSTSDTQDTDPEQFNNVDQVSTSDTQDTQIDREPNLDMEIAKLREEISMIRKKITTLELISEAGSNNFPILIEDDSDTEAKVVKEPKTPPNALQYM